MTTPWLTSDGLINSVKKSISFPISQITFLEDDILLFANEEMLISQVPSVLQYHEEYYVMEDPVPLVLNKTRYPIPKRAIGMKLRELYYEDSSGTRNKLSQIHLDDQDLHPDSSTGSGDSGKFFLQNNDVVIQSTGLVASGNLIFVYYIRPNKLVRDSRAAIVENFCKQITVSNTGLISGNTLTFGDLVLTAGTDFAIGATSIITTDNIVSAINTDGTYSATNGTPSTAIFRLFFEEQDLAISTSNSTSFSINSGLGIDFISIPSNITNGSKVDFLETESGHKIYDFDIKLGSNAITGNIIDFAADIVPEDFKVGDYIASQYECIIPFLPDDLHPTLVQRTCLRIVGAQGDKEGQSTVNKRIQDMQNSQSILIDNRSEGNTKKVFNRNSFLRIGKRDNIGK